MKLIVSVFAVFFGVAAVGFADPGAPSEKTVRSIDDVLRNAKRREKVLIAGTVKTSFDLDTVLLTDEKSEIAVSLLSVKQDVRPGDAIAVAGRFDGRLGYRSSYGLVSAFDWAPQNDPKFAALRNQYGVKSAAPAADVVPPAASAAERAPGPSIENRLRALDDLKSKQLITPEEYQHQRRRILDQL